MVCNITNTSLPFHICQLSETEYRNKNVSALEELDRISFPPSSTMSSTIIHNLIRRMSPRKKDME